MFTGMHTKAAVRGALRWSVGSVSRTEYVGTRLMVVVVETAVAVLRLRATHSPDMPGKYWQLTSLNSHLRRHSVTAALVRYFILDSIICSTILLVNYYTRSFGEPRCQGRWGEQQVASTNLTPTDCSSFFREIPYLAKFPTRRQPYCLRPFYHASPSLPMSNAKRTTRKDRI
ncbi:hypothetical protein GE21DRAFT_1223740 [Neurospora crassa]|nr:hypothetical protein B9J10.260 [imported] - Neurospora crassa [Neurospora crassa]KHE78301.1 hypothetical protein GE21DRAFT_1223740 [Neurospora crassa]